MTKTPNNYKAQRMFCTFVLFGAYTIQNKNRPKMNTTPKYNDRIFWIIAFLMIFLMTACVPKPTEKLPKKYFDLVAYAQQQTQYLTNNHPKATKYVALGTQTDTLTNAPIDWKQTMEIIAATDLNKPAFGTQYTTTITQNNDTTTTEYATKNPELTTKNITITRQNTRITQIEIRTQASNPLYTSTKKMIYKPQKTLEIWGNQQLFYGKKTDFYSKIIIQ
jgi:hypothetical protein